MPAAELEYIYNGLSIGVGSSTGSRWLVQDTGGLGLRSIRSERVPIAGANGERTYARYLAGNDFIFKGEYKGTDIAEVVEDFFTLWLPAFGPQDDDEPLHFNWPGLGPKYINCKVIERPYFDQDQLFSIGYTNWSVQFLAGDSTLYDDA